MAPEYSSFTNLVEELVIPLRDSDRSITHIDASSVGSNPATVAIFEHADRRWEVHGDTRIDPVMVAYAAACDGRDPFITERSRSGKRDTLRLAADLEQKTADPKHKLFFVYEL